MSYRHGPERSRRPNQFILHMHQHDHIWITVQSLLLHYYYYPLPPATPIPRLLHRTVVVSATLGHSYGAMHDNVLGALRIDVVTCLSVYVIPHQH